MIDLDDNRLKVARDLGATTLIVVDTAATSMLLRLVASGKLHPAKLVTHRFALGDIMKAYDTFGNAAQERALKVGTHSLALTGSSGQTTGSDPTGVHREARHDRAMAAWIAMAASPFTSSAF